MNSYSILLVNDRIEQLRREAAQRAQNPDQGSALARRLGGALKSVAAAITMPVTADYRSTTPVLDGYPYRG